MNKIAGWFTLEGISVTFLSSSTSRLIHRAINATDSTKVAFRLTFVPVPISIGTRKDTGTARRINTSSLREKKAKKVKPAPTTTIRTRSMGFAIAPNTPARSRMPRTMPALTKELIPFWLRLSCAASNTICLSILSHFFQNLRE